MILVVGSAGAIGRGVVRELVSRGAEVRAMVREFADTEELPTKGVTVVEADLRKPDTLDRALDGVDAAFLVTKDMPGSVERESAFIDAARRAGLPRLVKQARLHAAPDSPSVVHRIAWEIVEYLKASGVPHTIVRPQSWMQNTLLDAPTIQGQGVVYTAYGTKPMAMIDQRDAAAVVATTLLEDGHEGRDYTISGPAMISYPEAIDQLSEVIGSPITRVDLPIEALHEAFIGMGLPPWFADAYTGVVRFLGEGPAQVATTTAEELLGRPTIPFAKFAEDHKAAFIRETVNA